MRISDWSSDVCSSDLPGDRVHRVEHAFAVLQQVTQAVAAHRFIEIGPGAVLAGQKARGEAVIGGDRDIVFDAQILKFAFRSEEHTSELQSLIRISYAVFCLKKKKYVPDLHEYTQQT